MVSHLNKDNAAAVVVVVNVFSSVFHGIKILSGNICILKPRKFQKKRNNLISFQYFICYAAYISYTRHRLKSIFLWQILKEDLVAAQKHPNDYVVLRDFHYVSKI